MKPVEGEMNKYRLLNRRISEFYVYVDLSTSVELIEMHRVKNRCLLIKGGEYEIITPCVDLNEHD